VGERGKTATGKIPGIPPYKYSTACELDTETDKIITCSSITTAAAAADNNRI